MKRVWKKILAMALSIALVIGAIPLNGARGEWRRRAGATVAAPVNINGDIGEEPATPGNITLATAAVKPRDPSDYNTAHVAAINAIIAGNGLGAYGYMENDPDNWGDFAIWDDSPTKNLTGLYLYEWGLTGALSVAGIDSLETLECYGNSFTGLDVSGCAALTYLDCYDNELTSLDVSECTALWALYCGSNELETLTLGTLPWLGRLRCENNYLEELDLSGVDLLEHLACFNNQIDSLEIKHNAYLAELYCSTNLLTELDVSGMTYLEELECFMDINLPAGPLETLNMSGCSSLVYVDCVNNSITSLNVSGCTNLQTLYCFSNEIETLDVEGFNDLTVLDCVFNPFKSLTLPDGRTLTVNVNPAGAGDVYLTGTAYYGILDGPGITLTATGKLDYDFDSWTGDKLGSDAALSFNFDSDIAVTANFSGGAPIVSTDATLRKVAGQSLQNIGQQAGSSADPITAAVSVPSGKASIAATELECADFASVNLYTDSGFSLEETVNLNDGGISDADTDIYVKVTAEDTTIIRYYKITVTRLASDYNPDHVQAINDIIYNNIGTSSPDYVYMPGDPSAWDSFATWDKSSAPYQITGLDFSDAGLAGGMQIINISTLTDLDVSGNADLEELICTNNSLKTLNVSGCTDLTTLSCGLNRLSVLDLSGLANLENLSCGDNDLDALGLGDQVNLVNLSCSNNDIETLDVTNMASLQTLFCAQNALSSLTISNCAALRELDCSHNFIENLYASNLDGLKTLFCMNNALQTLDITGCSALESLECANNQLSTLNTEDSPNLNYLNCGQNPMNSLSLPDGETLTVSVSPLGSGTVGLGTTNDIMQDTTVTLTATAETGHTFVNWTGDKSGSNETNVIKIRPDGSKERGVERRPALF